MTNVTPIFKKGARHSPANYRPVSLTSVCCKMLEAIIKDEVVSHLERFKLIRPSQHSFMRGKVMRKQPYRRFIRALTLIQ